MTEKHNLQVGELGPDIGNYALIARQEKQIEALKTENDYLKKVKNPTEIENANLRQKNDALELENQSLQSEIQVMNWQIEDLESAIEVAKQDAESAKAQNLELIRQHQRKEKFKLFALACISFPVILLVSVVTYNSGHSNALNEFQESHDKMLNEFQESHNKMFNENRDNIQLGKVINYLFEHENSNGIIVYPTTVSSVTGVDYDDVLLILLKLEKRGIVTKSQFPGVGRQPQFQVK